MESAKGITQPQEARVNNLREVVLGFPKKIAQDEARRCPQCAQPTCLSGCPLGIDIPGFIRFLREGDAVEFEIEHGEKGPKAVKVKKI